MAAPLAVRTVLWASLETQVKDVLENPESTDEARLTELRRDWLPWKDIPETRAKVKQWEKQLATAQAAERSVFYPAEPPTELRSSHDRATEETSRNERLTQLRFQVDELMRLAASDGDRDFVECLQAYHLALSMLEPAFGPRSTSVRNVVRACLLRLVLAKSARSDDFKLAASLKRSLARARELDAELKRDVEGHYDLKEAWTHGVRAMEKLAKIESRSVDKRLGDARKALLAAFGPAVQAILAPTGLFPDSKG